MVNSSQRVGSILGNLSREQSDIKANLDANEQNANAVIVNREFVKLSGVFTATKRVYKSDSFIIDHPVYSDIDSSTLKIDGGYESLAASDRIATIYF